VLIIEKCNTLRKLVKVLGELMQRAFELVESQHLNGVFRNQQQIFNIAKIKDRRDKISSGSLFIEVST
jgi:hypothetical protein